LLTMISVFIAIKIMFLASGSILLFSGIIAVPYRPLLANPGSVRMVGLIVLLASPAILTALYCCLVSSTFPVTVWEAAFSCDVDCISLLNLIVMLLMPTVARIRLGYFCWQRLQRNDESTKTSKSGQGKVELLDLSEQYGASRMPIPGSLNTAPNRLLLPTRDSPVLACSCCLNDAHALAMAQATKAAVRVRQKRLG
jgi:hypothetical protein